MVVPQELVDQHVAGCAECTQWLASAQLVSRQATIFAAPALDELADRILDAVAARERPSRREWMLTRAGLCLIAALQLAITIPILILGHDREAPLHVSHEMGSWDAALAVGLLLAAIRPSRAEGMSALVGVGAALLCLTAAIDLAAGRTTLSDEAPHLLCVAGALLLYRLSVLHRLRPPGVSRSALAAPDLSTPIGEAGRFWIRPGETSTSPDISAQAQTAVDLTA